eukprot:1485172-Ditylum_brightwellii.AAC.2
MRNVFTCIFAVMTNLKETTNGHTNVIGSINDYTQNKNGKQQKHGANDNNLNNVMDESDTLHVQNRDALAPDKEGQGGYPGEGDKLPQFCKAEQQQESQ